VTTNIEVQTNVEMKTRDGLVLRADVYRPGGPGRRPAILVRTPYQKDGFGRTQCALQAFTAVAEGFAFVIQDVRGRHASEGDYSPIGPTEGDDGYDAVEWVASEPWCDGNVGMLGGSYCSLVQFRAAEQRPPSLKAIIPEKTGRNGAMGAFLLDSILIAWAAMQSRDAIVRSGDAKDLETVLAAFRRPREVAWHLPLNDLPFFRLPGLPTYQHLVDTMLSQPSADPARIAVPAMVQSAWYDMCPGEVSQLFQDLRSDAGSETARSGAQVLFGPWDHGPFRGHLGEWFFGNHADVLVGGFDLAQRQVNFFSRWLREDDQIPLPVATYFVMGSNVWKEADEWPPPGTVFVPLFLRSVRGEGTLAWDPPDGDEPPDAYDYDPMDPVPSVGGGWYYLGGSPVGPFEQSRIERRRDVLTYTTSPLATPLEIAGPVRLGLHAASSALDTDFVAKLCDVDTSGHSFNIAIGIVRARWRDGPGPRCSPLEPGHPYHFDLDLGAVAHRFDVGHCIRLQLTSSAFPGWDRNMNTGHELGTDAVGVVARQSIFHTSEFPSSLLLPTQSDAV
jgi:putative CocE/NonD family hydrolase